MGIRFFLLIFFLFPTSSRANEYLFSDILINHSVVSWPSLDGAIGYVIQLYDAHKNLTHKKLSTKSYFYFSPGENKFFYYRVAGVFRDNRLGPFSNLAKIEKKTRPLYWKNIENSITENGGAIRLIWTQCEQKNCLYELQIIEDSATVQKIRLRNNGILIAANLLQTGDYDFQVKATGNYSSKKTRVKYLNTSSFPNYRLRKIRSHETMIAVSSGFVNTVESSSSLTETTLKTGFLAEHYFDFTDLFWGLASLNYHNGKISNYGLNFESGVFLSLGQFISSFSIFGGYQKSFGVFNDVRILDDQPAEMGFRYGMQLPKIKESQIVLSYQILGGTGPSIMIEKLFKNYTIRVNYDFLIEDFDQFKRLKKESILISLGYLF